MPAPTPDQLSRAKALLAHESDIKFELGDIFLEIAPSIGGDIEWQTHPDKGHLEAFAESIDLAYSTCVKYRRVAEVFPKGHRRNDVSWAVHDNFRAHPEPWRIVKRRKWTNTSSREEMEKVRAANGSSTSTTPNTPAVTATITVEQMAAALAADPKLRAAVAPTIVTDQAAMAAAVGSNDVHTRAAAAKAIQGAYRQRNEAEQVDRDLRKSDDQRERDRKIGESTERIAILQDANEAARLLRKVAQSIIDIDHATMSDFFRQSLLGSTNNVENSNTLIQNYIESGVTLDDALADLLGEN